MPLPDTPPHDVRAGDRVAGAAFAGRSAAWGRRAAAAAAHPLATLAAIEILRAGGSAVDAAIAANAVLGVVEPTACGIGGDAFAMVWDPAGRRVVGLNGSGRSPRGLTVEIQRARARAGRIPSHGAVSVSTPGCVDAWGALHGRYGRLPWKALLEPAIGHAADGAPVAQTVAHALAANLRTFAETPGIEETENVRRLWAPAGETPREGEVFANPGLAQTLRLIADGGPRAFYDGEIAERIAGYCARIGGWLSMDDLAAHASEWVEPVSTGYRGVDVWALPPNTQGLAVLQMLNMLETFDVAAMGFQSAAAIHHAVEAKRLAFEDRARWYGDPAFYDAPVDWLVSKAYAAERARLIRPDRINPDVAPGQAPAAGDTTYLCVADEAGMMVSLIQSNFRGMGSGLVPDGLGFVLQNRGELFTLEDGHPNAYAPGKRPFQTIIPGFATRRGEPWLAFGVMGADMQPQGQVQVLSNIIDHGLGLQEAGDAPRWRHEGGREPTGAHFDPVGALNLEAGVPEASRAALAGLGWQLEAAPGVYGGYQAVQRWPGRYCAATEMRKDGVALAY